jgi:spermidine synthase
MLTTQGRPQDSFRYYELNPYVADLAREDFTFLKDAKSAISVVLGDGRLSLERELAAAGPQNYDLIHVDAFRGNAPPAHLMTAQAFAVYFKHLKPGGALAVTSHRDYYDASSLFRGMADLLGVEVRWFPAAKDCATGVGFAVFSRDPALFADSRIASRSGQWDDHGSSKIVWTDQSSSLMSLLIWSR